MVARKRDVGLVFCCFVVFFNDTLLLGVVLYATHRTEETNLLLLAHGEQLCHTAGPCDA